MTLCRRRHQRPRTGSTTRGGRGLFLLRERQTCLPKRPHTRGHFLSSRPFASNRVLFKCGTVRRTDQTLRRRDAGGRAAGNSFRTNKFGNSSGTIITSENVTCPGRYFLGPMHHITDTLGLHSVTLCYSKLVVKVKISSTIRQQDLLVNPLGVLDLFWRYSRYTIKGTRLPNIAYVQPIYGKIW
jgi:hypothetical protein